MRGFVHHIDLSVSDLGRSKPFYARVLGFMGYAHGEDYGDRGQDFDLHTEFGFSSIGVCTSEGPNATRAHDRYSPGLHHLAWSAASRADVDAFYAMLLDLGATILHAPADYPQYGSGYYAIFFADPDGLKLEYVFKP
jgi:glyoxylase I family protein